MSDDKQRRGAPESGPVAGSQDHEVDVLVRKYGVTAAQVKRVMKKVGSKRADIEAELKRQSR